jgi:hypothetical protein
VNTASPARLRGRPSLRPASAREDAAIKAGAGS